MSYLNQAAKLLSNRLASIASIGQCRFISKNNKSVKNRHNKRPLRPKILDAVSATIQQKGYLRGQTPYTPPPNVVELVRSLLSAASIDSSPTSQLSKEQKISLLTLCNDKFGRSVPNSTLFEVNTIDDVISFYETPVNSFLPLDEMAKKPLPPNLHIQHDYIRFNPKTDKTFGGKTAFYGSSTIVTGLKYRKKYPGHQAKEEYSLYEKELKNFVK